MELEEKNSSHDGALHTPNDDTNAQDHKDDVTDTPPRNSNISNFDILFLVISIVTHCTDVCVDVNIVVQYYRHDKIPMFIWTIALILIPSFINTVVSLQMYRQDEEKNIDNDEHPSICKKVLKKTWETIVVAIIVVSQFTMAHRSFRSLKFALKSRNCMKKNDKMGQRKYFIKMLKEEQDIALLRVLECFIEAAPQQILQLSIFVQDYYGEFSLLTVHQVISIASSFISLAWAMVSYHRSIRLAQTDKKNIHFIGSVLQFFWYFCITTARIACVSAAAISSTLCVISACFIHWLGMTLWIILESRGLITFCRNPKRAPHLPLTIMEKIKSTLFSCVLGFVYIFIYLNPEDSGTYAKHLFYYSICLLENLAASILVLSSLPADVEIVRYHYIVSAFCIIPFMIGIILMIIYYIKYHPTLKHHTYSFSKLLRLH
ncbi:hypothetical protein QAD02_018541 [Eretmocerus hayati]|uniref:Uncharacterized protein n=1 Tax=Eretmocerus hayati TaxID=131215 RepID=A0ACC2PGN5_9HYME|nr:hypothetical protein QAD02_018541 [Eretmocerus hayati]